MTADRVIDADRGDFVAALADVEGAYGLPRTDLARLVAALPRPVNHAAKVDRHIPGAHTRIFPRTTHFDGWPDHASFLCAETESLIRRIHRIDFDVHGAFF